MKPKDEGPELFRGAILYREWGCRFTALKQFMKAIKYFEKSIELSDGNDLRTLLSLTKALMTFTRYRAAAEIADMCMEIDPKNYQVIWMRVETLYKITEFGHSLIYSYQGQRRRPFPFKWGIYQANETIEDCVGNNTSPAALRELYPWIKEMQNFIEELKAKKDEIKDEFEGIDEENTKFKINDATVKEEAYLKKHQSFMAEIYLRNLAKDKHFVEEMLQRPGLWSASKKSNEELENLVKLCLLRLTRRQEMLRLRKPLYCFRFMNKMRTLGHKKLMQQEKQILKNNFIIYADFLLRTLNSLRKQKDYARFFRFAERIKSIFDSHSNKIFPLKQKCLKTVYNMVGWTYLETRDLSTIKNKEIKKVYMKHHIGMHVAKLPRDTDIGWVPTFKKKQALQEVRRKLAMTNDPLELAWIFHDFTKLLMEMHRYEWARYYAKRARDKSMEINNQAWFINANHLLLRIEIHQHNRNDAKEAALLALSSARKQKINYLIDFYKGIVKILDETDIEKMAFIDNIAIREQLILDLMPMELKTEMDYLLRTMNVVPSKRRLSVMPGCKPIDKKYDFACKKRTILVSPPRDLEKDMRETLLQMYAPTKKILGFVDFEEYE